MKGNKPILFYQNRFSFLYFISARLSNSEDEKIVNTTNKFIYLNMHHCLLFVLYLSFDICCSQKRE